MARDLVRRKEYNRRWQLLNRGRKSEYNKTWRAKARSTDLEGWKKRQREKGHRLSLISPRRFGDRLYAARVPLSIKAALREKLLAMRRCHYCGVEVSFILAQILAGGKRQAQIEHLNGKSQNSELGDFSVACADCNFALRFCRTEQEKWLRIAEAKAALEQMAKGQLCMPEVIP